MRYWLARLHFSFLIVGFYLAWEAYRSNESLRGYVSPARILLLAVGSMCCFVLGFLGVRERHRPQR